MVFLAMVRERNINQLAGIRSLPGDPHLLRAKAYIYSFRGTVPLINGEEIFYVCHDEFGGSMVIATLLAAVRNRGR